MGVSISLGHCPLWGTGRSGERWVKRLVLGLAHTVMTFKNLIPYKDL